MKASDNPYPSVLLEESAAPAAPAAGHQRLFVDPADHTPKRIDHAGAVSPLGSGGGGFTPSPDYTFVSGDLADPASYWGTSSVHIFSWTAPKTGYVAIYPGWQTTDLFNAETMIWHGNVANTDYPDRTAGSGGFGGHPVADAADEGKPAILKVVAGQVYTVTMTTFENDTGKAITTQEWANAIAIFDGVGELPYYSHLGSLDLARSTDVGAPFCNDYLPVRKSSATDRTTSDTRTLHIPKVPSGATSWSSEIDWYYKANTDTNGDLALIDPRAEADWYLAQLFIRVTNLDDGSWATWTSTITEAEVPTPATGHVTLLKTATGGYATAGPGATGVTVPDLTSGVFGFDGTHNYLLEITAQCRRRALAHPSELQNIDIYR